VLEKELPPTNLVYLGSLIRFYTEDEVANDTKAVVIFHLDFTPSLESSCFGERSTYSTFGCPPLGICQLLVLAIDVGASSES
jgi:hypothetical protein